MTSQSRIGKRYRFRYPDYGIPDGHPEHTAHSGQIVTVQRQLTNKECDPECQPMFKIQADDGWIGTANGDELIRIGSKERDETSRS